MLWTFRTRNPAVPSDLTELSGALPWKQNSLTEPIRFSNALRNYGIVFDYDQRLEQIRVIENETMVANGFWDHQESAQETVATLKSLKAVAGPLTDMLAASDDLAALLEMAAEDPDIEAEVTDELRRLETALEDLELKSLSLIHI